MRGCVNVILCVLAGVPPSARALAQPPGSRPAAGAEGALRDVRARLRKQFDGYLERPQQYARRVHQECRSFPEGDLFPYVLPAMAQANLAVADPKHRPAGRKRIAQCIDLAIPSVVRRVRPPGGKLQDLRAFGDQATYLGQLNLALGCYRLVGGDDRYEAIHKRLSDVLHAALVERQGRPLESYPSYSWSFDTAPVLVSLALRDRHTGGSQAPEVTRQHLAWLKTHSLDPATGLPRHRCGLRTGRAFGSPRGCDLSMRLALLARIDLPTAKELYRAYVRHFWIERNVVAGFAEWPGGRAGRQDIDSGPVVMGVGMSASGMGIAAATAVGDGPRRRRLCEQLADLRQLLRLTLTPDASGRPSFLGVIPYRPEYVTGFLMGDACLFYAVTWQDWDLTPAGPTTRRSAGGGRPKPGGTRPVPGG